MIWMPSTVLSAGSSAALEELIALRRKALNALASDAPKLELGRLHLAIGLSLAAMEGSRFAEAIEEVRQALAQLPDETARFDHAEARYHLGRLLLDRAMLFMQHDDVSGVRAQIQEAAYHLEHAHRVFSEERCAAAQVEAARRWSHALGALGQYPRSYALLERERAEHEGELRRWIELCLAEHALADPDPARQAQGAEILAAYFEPADSAPQGTDDIVMDLVGLAHPHLPASLVARALAWLETRSGAPKDLLISLRTRVYPSRPERGLTAPEKAELVATMDDPAASIPERAAAAYTMISALPKHEMPLQRRACELLEIWLESPEIHPLQKRWYRHDLAVAMRMSAQQDASWLERAARHLEIALDELRRTPDYPVAANNLVRILLDLLELRAATSSPALLSIVARLQALALDVPAAEARELRLVAATQLMRGNELTHPECMVTASALIESTLHGDPEDADAHRLRYLHAWHWHLQGGVDRETVDRLAARARSLGKVPDLDLLDGAQPALARALAGSGSLEGQDLALVATVIPIRPDALDHLLTEVERRFTISGVGAGEQRALVEVAVHAVSLATSGDEVVRGRRLAALMLKHAPYVDRGALVALVHTVRGPAADSLRAAIRSAGVSLHDPEPPASVDRPSDDRVTDLHRHGVERMDQAQRCLLARDEDTAKTLFQEAQRTLDEARKLARDLSPERRAVVQISAGNARRRRAVLDAALTTALLDEAETLYREAWPWTEGHPASRAQLAKVLADTLIARNDAPAWAEAMELYRTSLAGRPQGFTRWETLSAIADAELVGRGQASSIRLLAALAHLDEALDHVGPGEKARTEITAARMLRLLQELARDSRVGVAEIARFARRIAVAAPELASDAELAMQGLAVGGSAAGESGSLDAGALEVICSEFSQTYVRASEISRAPQAIESIPAHFRDSVREAAARGSFDPAASRPNDVKALREAAQALRRGPAVESSQARAGRLVARARLLERIELLHGPTGKERIAACAEAEAGARAIEHPGLRGFALAELARTWQIPGPSGDFARSARLLDDAFALIPVAWIMARADATASHARASRYREDLSAQEAIARAIASYQEAEELYRRIGHATGVAGMLKNLAEAVGARQDRPRAVALRESLEIERKAIALARKTQPSFLAELLGNHAYGLTRLAETRTMLHAEQTACLTEADRFFEEALRLNTDPVIGATIENNRLIWRSLTATEGDRAGIVTALRDRLRPLDPRRAPRDWAMAAHNLADELFEQRTGQDDLREALDLWRKALSLRPIEAEPQFHWETAERLGELLASLHVARRTLDFAQLRLTPMSARSQAIECFQSALRAARSLGPGACSTRSARHLGLLAADVDPGDAPDLTLAGEALAALQAVLVLVPDDQHAGIAEADVAAAVARALALHRARTAAVPEVSATGAAVLHDAAAWEVLHWMLRARGGQHRRLRARMIRPTTVPPEVWTTWRLSLRSQANWDERREAVRAVQVACPSFLAGTPELGDTLAWMNATGGAAAMLLETNGAWLLGVLVPSEAVNAIRASVVLLRASPPTLTLADLLGKLRAPSFDGAAADAGVAARKELDHLVLELRAAVLPDLLETMPSNPGPILWSPHGVAAGIPLGLVWEDLPSIWTTPCMTLPPRLSASTAVSSALLVLAEAEDAPPIPGEEGMAHIARTLAEHGCRVEVLFGRAQEVGRDVAGDLEIPGLLSSVAPTPDEVKRRMPDHRLIVILAHGHYDEVNPATSSIDLVDSVGRTAQLTAEALSERPDLLLHAVVVLLSCETGAAGALSAAPAGLAGSLLAVGAAAVVAPLWPVYCGDALLLGARVAHAIASGIELGAAIQTAIGILRATLGDGSANESPYGLAPFVVWTG